ncbi:selenoneine biosynthesis selenosugar synthase SenB [Marinobacter sp. ANT_B65]|uniref:selenoneine biosynthesis selenosugar synthase SenB n=1 Tax=Marinobacter sp. ANT_B65 TaxID=2039467 RepID=UPI000BBE0A6D|nr:selenoneine biosynthesis selenosugar synthase SenB [Marinobacter sp. ANT_B65]PCM45820.1 TIGR04348 family glycosyltransferase [Marinobacter sp. ANT_B65]
MYIIMITPAGPESKAGNRATAERWQTLLEQAGHKVSVVTEYLGEPCDLFLALHAWRSREAIRLFREANPGKPLVVALTGTDIYLHQYTYPEETLWSMNAADVLIGLHESVGDDIPEPFVNKLVTLFQSAGLPAADTKKSASVSPFFDVCVIGHLRDEKDSLRAAKAARLLRKDSCIRVSCAGKPLDVHWAELTEQEVRENPRFRWLGELSKKDTARLMTNSQMLVLSSLMEGGANVISEACRSGLPVIASDIPGNKGLLGKDYAGYYPRGDTRALADVLERAETDAGFLEHLREQVGQLASQFTPEKEQESLEQALSLAVKRSSGNGL